MKFLMIMLLAFVANACGGRSRFVDPRLLPTLQLYLDNAPDRGLIKRLYELKFGQPSSDDYEGETINGRLDNGDPAIVIVVRDQPGDDCKLQRLVLHELGHALHDLEHSDDENSLMYREMDPHSKPGACKDIEAQIRAMFQ